MSLADWKREQEQKAHESRKERIADPTFRQFAVDLVRFKMNVEKSVPGVISEIQDKTITLTPAELKELLEALYCKHELGRWVSGQDTGVEGRFNNPLIEKLRTLAIAKPKSIEQENT